MSNVHWADEQAARLQYLRAKLAESEQRNAELLAAGTLIVEADAANDLARCLYIRDMAMLINQITPSAEGEA